MELPAAMPLGYNRFIDVGVIPMKVLISQNTNSFGIKSAFETRIIHKEGIHMAQGDEKVGALWHSK